MNPLMLLLMLILAAVASDCQQDNSNPSSNCFMHCIINFSKTPQRRYYNITNGNCQKMNGCPSDLSKPYYYDYVTNRCYQTPAMRKIVEGPEEIQDFGYDTESSAKQFVCVNGNEIVKPLVGLKCQCLLLWTNSGKLAETNVPLLCDQVEKRLDVVFNNLTIENGVVVKYDNFSASDIQKILSNALQIEANQSLIIPKNTTILIQYDLNKLPPGQIISQNEIYWLYILIAILIILLLITLYQWWKNKKAAAMNLLRMQQQAQLISPGCQPSPALFYPQYPTPPPTLIL